MTPALSLAFLADPPGSAPLLPRMWHGVPRFGADDVERLLDNLRAGFSRDRAARDATGMRNAIDAGKALAAACEACPALAAEVARAESEGRQRLRVEGVGGGAQALKGDQRDAARPHAKMSAHGATSGEAEHEGGEQVHAPQGAAAATTVQVDAWSVVGAAVPSARPADSVGRAGVAVDGHPVVMAERAEQATEHAERMGARSESGKAPAREAAWAERGQPGTVERPRVEIVVAALSPLDALAREAAVYAPGDFGYVLLVNQRCVDAGMHPMSPWWRWSVGSFYASAKPWGIFLVGRGGGKSVTLERVAASVARYGARMVPPGQTWTWPFISVGPDDANRRINGIAAVFRADGLAIVGDIDGGGEKVKAGQGVKIARAPRGSLELLDVRGNEIQLASIAGTIGNVSGPSTIGLTIDEAAKLIDARGANPLTEIVASAGQTSRGRFGWRAIMSSSAFDRAGIHFQMIDAGDNDVNFIATIGAAFLDHALDGFERVASWEQRRGDTVAARIIREHAASLRADSPLVPTWTAFPGFGNPATDARGYLTGEAWDGAALATRMLVEALPEAALDGVPRVSFWLRECGSLPMDRAGGVDPMRQIDGLAEMNAALAAVARGEQPQRVVPGADVPAMKLRGMRPGDARYDSRDAQTGPWRPPGWDRGDVF